MLAGESGSNDLYVRWILGPLQANWNLARCIGEALEIKALFCFLIKSPFRTNGNLSMFERTIIYTCVVYGGRARWLICWLFSWLF